jgi:hypothetical protein
MGAYVVEMNRTASTSASVGTITADATRPRRGKMYDWMFGSEASPADNAFLWQAARVTTAGTGSAVTPTATDPGDAATESDSIENATIEPSYTANAILLSIPLNQRATFRWVAAPYGELVYPATASNGIGIKTPTSSAVAITTTIHYNEQ